MGEISVARVYDDPPSRAGHRVLVDRLWPRGIGKDAAPIDEWMKDVAPSTDLRKWYGHDVSRFDEFARRYRAELTDSPASEAIDTLLRRARKGSVVLVTATRDVEHSGAVVLVKHLRRRR